MEFRRVLRSVSPLAFVVAFACSDGAKDTSASGSTGASPSTTSGGGGTGGAGGACPNCTTDQDCAPNSVCAQLGDDSYCAPSCPNGTECSSDRTCVPASGVDGTQLSVCAPQNQPCSPSSGDGGGAPSDMCGALVGPDVAAGCVGCNPPNVCQPNGCFLGWWCNTGSKKCQAPPTECTGLTVNAGDPVTGTIDGSGGKISRILFAVAGDTRPPTVDDTADYPNKVIKRIYTDIEAFTPHPPFLVSSGDYMFAKASGTESGPQLDDYLVARHLYSGTTFAAMGNHECNGGTSSNCGPGTTLGSTNNYKAFISKLLGPINQTKPYYSIKVDAIDGSWTSKFVFIAGNAWSTAQATWLETTLAKPTTYTFILRHEAASITEAPGVTPSEKIMAQHPYTLAIVGHTHTYKRTSTREIIVGNGGAPLTGSKNYGFAIINQRADKAIQVDMIDYQTGLGDPSFHFALNPDGTPAAEP